MTVPGLFFAVAVAVAWATRAGAAPEPWEQDYRIPRDVVPVSYDLFLHPRLPEGRFSGEVTAVVNLTAPRTWLPIHIKSTNVTSTLITDKAGKPVKLVDAFKYLKSEFWVMKTEKMMPGLYNLKLKFEGSLVESLQGFYRSVYRENGTLRMYFKADTYLGTSGKKGLKPLELLA